MEQECVRGCGVSLERLVHTDGLQSACTQSLMLTIAQPSAHPGKAALIEIMRDETTRIACDAIGILAQADPGWVVSNHP